MSKVSFKKFLTGVALLASLSAQAASDGFYVTGQLGYGSSKVYKDVREALETSGQSKKKGDLKGLAGRGAIGYQIDENFAIELGWSKIKSKSFSASFSEIESTSTGPVNVDIKLDSFRKSAAVDFILRALLPLEQIANGFNLYGKLGVAYLEQFVSTKAEEVRKHGLNITTRSGSLDERWKKLAPAFGLGMSYEVAPNLPVELSWTRIQPVGGDKDVRPGAVDFFALGIGYHFG